MEAQCNLIIDSCCDLPYSVVARPGVQLLEFPYMIDGQSFSDDFYRTTQPKDFYDAMRDKKRSAPSTAQLTAQTPTDIFTRALMSGVPTVYLSFTSGLSGSYDVACMVAEQLAGQYPDNKLYIVDTKLASIAEGLLVLEAIAQRDKGLSAEEMVRWAEEARYYVNALFMVDDLDSLARGGRIPAGVALAGSKLGVKPLLGFDLQGKLAMTGVARGRKKGMKALADYCGKRLLDTGGAQQVVLGHADCQRDLDRLRDHIAEANTNALFLETNIGPVIGSHVGPGMLACVFWGPDRREDISVADRIARRVKERN